MRYYIVDDSLSIVKVLNRIVEEQNLGEVIGFSIDEETAAVEIMAQAPDIVLIDYLMPKKDGVSLVREIKKMKPQISFIMISQVSNKEMIAEAYKEGVEFFISKPINLIEVVSVLRNVNERMKLKNMVGEICEIFEVEKLIPQRLQTHSKQQQMKDIKYHLSILGMIGETGTCDIIKICEEQLQKGSGDIREGISCYCSRIDEDPKVVKQRIRRAVKKGLTNIAAMGVEDYYNEIFQTYHQGIFDFQSIRAEMDYLRGKNTSGGKPNVDKFIEGLLLFNEIH
ncbi:DNA-binding domain-containing protein [Clostridium aminobutyricum]|uniref:Stage 0 sporulation protein A homolog n=1 Tax=Clostridium aminobutyricum TaxID=33953 RepID=A0A939D9S7_CLOAM|nr:DNA-binding domain-containing protein [Clostridium aminobutyricum]MBN7773796.1 DNA-binding domain-containing protein [Clostridium aminobutyricum]